MLGSAIAASTFGTESAAAPKKAPETTEKPLDQEMNRAMEEFKSLQSRRDEAEYQGDFDKADALSHEIREKRAQMQKLTDRLGGMLERLQKQEE